MTNKLQKYFQELNFELPLERKKLKQINKVNILNESNPDSVDDYLTALASSDRGFSPFNLCLFQVDKKSKMFDGRCYSRSRAESVVATEGPTAIERAEHGLGNSPMSVPFQKTLRGKAAFEDVVRALNQTEKKSELEEKLFAMMRTSGPNLPDNQMELQGSKSIFKSFHDKLSSIFVEMPDQNYGTRMQTLILVDFDLNATFVERRREESATADWKEERFEFKIEN